MSLNTFRRLADQLMHIPQAVGDRLDYSMDWSAWLRAGEVIVSSAWTADAGVVLDTPSNTSPLTVVWVTSPAAGSFSVTNRIVTSGGRDVGRTFVIDVQQRLS